MSWRSHPLSTAQDARIVGRERAAAGKIGYCDHDEADRAVVYLGEPIRSDYVLIQHDHLASVTSLEADRWKWAHPEVCRRTGIGSTPLRTGGGSIGNGRSRPPERSTPPV